MLGEGAGVGEGFPFRQQLAAVCAEQRVHRVPARSARAAQRAARPAARRGAHGAAGAGAGAAPDKEGVRGVDVDRFELAHNPARACAISARRGTGPPARNGSLLLRRRRAGLAG